MTYHCVFNSTDTTFKVRRLTETDGKTFCFCVKQSWTKCGVKKKEKGRVI